jgi:hypothetical protein
MSVNRPVGDALQAFRAGRAKLGADEQLDRDRTVRGLLDIVLEYNEAVIVLVVFIGIGSGAQRDVGGLSGGNHAAGQHRQAECSRSQCFECVFQDHQCSSRWSLFTSSLI